MKVTYDPKADALSIMLRSMRPEHSEELAPGIRADYDADENVIGFEILDASERVDRPNGVEFVTLAEPIVSAR